MSQVYSLLAGKRVNRPAPEKPKPQPWEIELQGVRDELAEALQRSDAFEAQVAERQRLSDARVAQFEAELAAERAERQGYARRAMESSAAVTEARVALERERTQLEALTTSHADLQRRFDAESMRTSEFLKRPAQVREVKTVPAPAPAAVPPVQFNFDVSRDQNGRIRSISATEVTNRLTKEKKP